MYLLLFCNHMEAQKVIPSKQDEIKRMRKQMAGFR